MELRAVFQVVRKRFWLVVLGTLLGAIITFLASKSMTPIYQAKVTLMINQSTSAPFADRVSLLTGENLAVTYSRLLKTRPLMEIVIANLGLDLSPGALAKRRVGTDLVPDTQLLELTVDDPNPQQAADIANEIAFTFISMHNSEQQLEDIVTLEQEVVTQMADLKELIEYNQLILGNLSTSPDRLNQEESSRTQSNLSAQQSAYASLSAAYLNIRLAQAQLLDVSVAEPAVAPKSPVRPNVRLFTVMGAFLGLNLGAGLVFLLESLDRSLMTSDDVAQMLSMPTLGQIPVLKKQGLGDGLIASTDPRSTAVEAYRILRTNIGFVSVDKPLRTLLITSAEPREGKTTIAANLGTVYAQAGTRVVLLDTDLRVPALHRPFGRANHSGLTDLLVGTDQNAEECMVGTGIDNLRLIASGPVPPNPAELLGSKRMGTVLAQVMECADLLILDAPPVLAVADAAVLAQEVDGVLLVVRAGKTWHEVAQNALEGLMRVRANVVGVVLNAVPAGKGIYPYYSPYEYSEDASGVRAGRLYRLSGGLAAVRRLFG